MGLFDKFFGPDSEAKFAEALTGAIRRSGDDRRFDYDADQRRLVCREGDNVEVINLANLYSTYCGLSKNERPAWLKNVCLAVLNRAETPTDFEEAKPDLMPAVRSRSMLEFSQLIAEAEGNDLLDIPSIQMSDYLVVCLVYDLPQSMRFVTQKDLSDWSIPVYQAMEVARQNLNQQPPASYGKIGEGCYVLQTNDAYDASRMLSLDVIPGLKVEGKPIALPVNRDCLLITGADDVEGLEAMGGTAEAFTEEMRPICTIPHILDRGEWQPWSVPSDHPAAKRFQFLRLQHFGSEYAEQKPLLETIVEMKGLDVFVASFSGLQNESTGNVRSYCMWSSNVCTWLPRADLIAFFDADTEQKTLVPWDQAVSEFGEMMTPLDYWPPRWSVEQFPEMQRLQGLGVDDQ